MLDVDEHRAPVRRQRDAGDLAADRAERREQLAEESLVVGHRSTSLRLHRGHQGGQAFRTGQQHDVAVTLRDALGHLSDPLDRAILGAER
jgi:hypothetical protein